MKFGFSLALAAALAIPVAANAAPCKDAKGKFIKCPPPAAAPAAAAPAARPAACGNACRRRAGPCRHAAQGAVPGCQDRPLHEVFVS